MEETKPSEPYPGIIYFDLLSETCCFQIWEELHRYEQLAIQQPEWGLPLNVRHDGNLGSLQDCGFGPLLEALNQICQPLVAKHLPNIGKFQIYHSFLTRNHVSRQENATFKVHCDKK